MASAVSVKYRPHDRVKVRIDSPPGHFRTPAYIQGKTGRIAALCGVFPNPESLAYHGSGLPKQPLYRVEFEQREVWAEYPGPAGDKLLVDIYQHWLDPVNAQETAMNELHGASDPHSGHEAHPGVEADTGPGYYALRARAMEDLLVARGYCTREEVQREVDLMDARSPSDGARVVARAWVDSDYKARLLADAHRALAEVGYQLPDTTPRLAVVENTDTVHHLVVCTLCSCYPRMLLGRPPDWYKSLTYRSRAVADPRAVMREFGLELGENIQVRVLDSTADLRYLVLPRRPDGTADLSEAALAALVTRDSMIGVSLPRSPETASAT